MNANVAKEYVVGFSPDEEIRAGIGRNRYFPSGRTTRPRNRGSR
jgi:hypothetical protein